MHNDLQNLIKILIPDALMGRSDQHSHAHILERSSTSKIRKITISDLPPDTLVFQICDSYRGRPPRMSLLFQINNFGHNKACDAFIVQRTDSGWNCLFIDLKSDKPHGYAAQFNSTRCFWIYLKELIESLSPTKKTTTQEHYLVINTGRSKKRSTVPIHSGTSAETPKFMRVLDEAIISFPKLTL